MTSAEDARTDCEEPGSDRSGEPDELFEVDEPAAPAAGEVVIDVVAAGIGTRSHTPHKRSAR